MKFKQLREKYRSKFPASLVAAAVKIALDMGGNMTGAYKKIEKMKRGLGDDPMVKDALRLANEDVNEKRRWHGKDLEKLVDLFNQLMDVKHGGPEYKKIKMQIDKLKKESVNEGVLDQRERALNLKLKELELRMKQKEFEETYAEFNDDDEEVKEKLSAKDKKKRLDMIRKAVEKINAKNAERAKKDALKMMKDLDF